MHYVDVDLDNCLRAVKLAKKRLQRSKAPDHIKALGAAISPIIVFDYRRKTYLGEAWATSERSRDVDRKKYGIVTSKYPNLTYTHGGRRYFMVITIFPKGFHSLFCKSKTRKFLNRVLAHEFAHLIDIVDRKQIEHTYSISNPKTDHDEHWQKISRWCGGDTNPNGEIPT